MKRITIDFSKEDLDLFLKENYGYEYWNFADSLFSVYALYRFRDLDKITKLIKSRIKGIENLKKKVVELIDYFLIDIDFYKNSPTYSSSNEFSFKWTLNNKKSFIIGRFQLEPLFTFLNDLINEYRNKAFPYSETGSKIYLKPINLVIMIWCYAFKKNNRINWVNLEVLLYWFMRKLEKMGMLHIYGVENKEIPSPERMRFINNKYKGTVHEKTAFYIFMNSFRDKDEILRSKQMSFISTNAEKIDYLDPLVYLDEHYWDFKGPQGMMKLFDMSVAFKIREE